MAVATGPQFDDNWFDNFYDIFVTVGDDTDYTANTSCVGSPFYPTHVVRGRGFETTCDAVGRYLTLFKVNVEWFAISMIAVFIECSCTSMIFSSTAPVYADVEVAFGAELVQDLTEVATMNPGATDSFCSVNYADECTTPLEATLDNLDPLPAFMTLS